MVLRTQRTDVAPDLIQISTSNPAQTNREKDHWYLRYQKRLPEHGNLKCGIALKLDFQRVLQTEIKVKIPLSQQMKLVSDNGRLCIFFPAEKENTGLNFYLNGPYASTIDRASIRHDDPDNQSIMDITSELWVDVLERIRDNNLLTADFLTVLPNDDDTIEPFYAKIREATYNSLKTKNLLPTQSENYANAETLLRGPKTLTNLLSDKDVAFLSGEQGRKWVINVMRHNRADKLLQSVGIQIWGNDEFLESVKEYTYSWSDDKLKFNTWFIQKEIDWVRNFYLTLWAAAKKEQYHLVRHEIVLTENGSLVSGRDIYFPPEENTSDLGLPLVKRSLLTKAKPEKLERLRSFLSAIGVNEIGEEEELKTILEEYYVDGSHDLSEKQHQKHMQRFIEWTQQSGDYRIFKWKTIFFDRNKQLRSADECYIDFPLLQTGMTSIGEITETVPLWKGYSNIQGFVEFAKHIGIQSELKISQQYIPYDHPNKEYLHEFRWKGRESNYCINRDFQISNMTELLESNDLEILSLIWVKMCKARKPELSASYRPNKSFNIKTAPSSLVHSLTNSSWIPTKNGQLYPPQKVTREMLLDEYIYDNRNDWLTAIGFGEEAAQATEEYRAKQQSAQSIGIDIEDAEFIRNNHEEFEKWKEEQKSKREASSFPDKPSKNQNRRKKKIAQKVKDAPKKKYCEKTRTVRKSRNLVDPAPWLITQYTNDDGHMFCQLCQKELSVASFKKRDGDEYFECVEILNNDKLDIEYEAQFLALCPLCAAKYKEFVKRDTDSSEWLLEQLMEENNFEISLKLGEEQVVLRFVETHYHDLHVVLWGTEDGE